MLMKELYLIRVINKCIVGLGYQISLYQGNREKSLHTGRMMITTSVTKIVPELNVCVVFLDLLGYAYFILILYYMITYMGKRIQVSTPLGG